MSHIMPLVLCKGLSPNFASNPLSANPRKWSNTLREIAVANELF